MTTHSGVKPHPCKDCGVAFSRLDKLRKHRSLKHDVSGDTEEERHGARAIAKRAARASTGGRKVRRPSTGQSSAGTPRRGQRKRKAKELGEVADEELEEVADKGPSKQQARMALGQNRVQSPVGVPPFPFVPHLMSTGTQSMLAATQGALLVQQIRLRLMAQAQVIKPPAVPLSNHPVETKIAMLKRAKIFKLPAVPVPNLPAETKIAVMTQGTQTDAQ
jgi:hypothetical protein